MQSGLTGKKEPIVVFDRSARGHGDLPYFHVFGQRLLEASWIRAGENVLDVACGRGELLLRVAEQTGRYGKIIGVDISAEMVEKANAAIRAQGLKKAIVLQMDPENLQFPDASFDHVLCSFSLPFFPNRARALAEFLRVLKPGGSLAVSTWGAGDERWNRHDEQRQSYGVTLKLAGKALHGLQDVCAIIRQAGFVEVDTWQEEYDWVYANEQNWWSAIWSIAGRAALENLSPSALERFKAEAFQKMRPLREPEGFHLLLRANFATGIKPY